MALPLAMPGGHAWAAAESELLIKGVLDEYYNVLLALWVEDAIFACKDRE